MFAAEKQLWAEPRRWTALRAARRRKLLGVTIIIAATAALLPSIWIVAMPGDPLFRPDVTRIPAIVVLGLCISLLLLGRHISRVAVANYGTALYDCVSQARQAGARTGLIFDIELPQLFPRVLFARRHRMMAIALPQPVLIPIDDVESVTVSVDDAITVNMKDTRKQGVVLFAGDGLNRQSAAETSFVADRLREFVSMPQSSDTDEERQQRELAEAFLASPSLR